MKSNSDVEKLSHLPKVILWVKNWVSKERLLALIPLPLRHAAMTMCDWVDRNFYCVLNLCEGPYIGEQGFISGSPRGGMHLWPVYNANSICSDSNMPFLGFKWKGQGQVLTGGSLYFQKGENSWTHMLGWTNLNAKVFSENFHYINLKWTLFLRLFSCNLFKVFSWPGSSEHLFGGF